MKLFIEYCVTICFIALAFSCNITKKEEFFIMDKNDFKQYFNAEESSTSILVKTNKDLIVQPQNTSWCKAEVWTAQDEKKLIITVSENRLNETRSTDIVLIDHNQKTDTIQVTQIGNDPAILIKEDTIHISDDLIFSVNVISNVPVKFDLPEWIEEDKKSTAGNNNGTYFFQTSKLPKEENFREGKIIFKGENNEIETTISILQTENQPRFIVLSNITIGRGDAKEKLSKKLNFLLKDSRPVDAIFLVGDLTGRGAPVQYQELKSICNSYIPQDIPVYFMMGNTDYYIESGDKNFENEIQQPLHQYFSIKGYPFVTLSMTGIYTDKFTQEDKDFLFHSLKDAAEKYPDKPIFFFTHIGMSDTFYGTEKEKTSNLGSEVLAPVLVQFPQLIAFSGHTNFPLGDPRSIHQDIFTSVNIGSGIHCQMEYGFTEGMFPPNHQNVSEALVVNVRKEGDIIIERWDTYRGEEILPEWEVKSPHDGSNFTYKNRNGGTAPYFSEKDKASIIRLEDGDYAVIFPKAEDDEVVHHYIIEVLSNKEVVFRNTRFSQFYLNSHSPKTFTVKLLGLPPNVPLIAHIKAVDSYNNISDPLVSEMFEIQAFIPREGIKLPVADLFDIQFGENGKALDLSPNKNNIENGKDIPETYFSDRWNRYIAKFKNVRSSFYKIDYKNNDKIKNAFTNGFAFETIYMSHNLSNSAPLSGKEWEGFGIEQEEGGQIEFWAYLDDKYKKAKSSVYINTGEYYHVVATYDKATAKMRIYVNGKKAGEIDAPGDVLIPHRLDSQWLCIGGDTHPSGLVQHPLDGEVAVVRMYSRSLTDDEVYLLYQKEFKN